MSSTQQQPAVGHAPAAGLQKTDVTAGPNQQAALPQRSSLRQASRGTFKRILEHQHAEDRAFAAFERATATAMQHGKSRLPPSAAQPATATAAPAASSSAGNTASGEEVVPVVVKRKRGRPPKPRPLLPTKPWLMGSHLESVLSEVRAVVVSSSSLPVGTPVWVKMTGYCAWPGLVWCLDLCARCTWPDVVSSYEKGKLLVRFYGDHSSSWVAPKQLVVREEGSREEKMEALQTWGKKNSKLKLVHATLDELSGRADDNTEEMSRMNRLGRQYQLDYLQAAARHRHSALIRPAADPQGAAALASGQPSAASAAGAEAPAGTGAGTGVLLSAAAAAAAAAAADGMPVTGNAWGVCDVCREEVPDMRCSSCQRWLHALCSSPAALTPQEYPPDQDWSCPCCGATNTVKQLPEEELLCQAAGQGAAAERMGLTPDWIISTAAFMVFKLPRPTADQPYIAGLLDPCSNSKHEPNIPAEKLYDKRDDGLKPSNSWKGFHVILNPDYRAQVQWRFVNRAIDEVENGSVPAVLLVCRNSTDTAYFQRLRPYPRVLLRRSNTQFKDYDKCPIGFGVVVFCIATAAHEGCRQLYERFYQGFSPFGEPNIPIDTEFLLSPAFYQLLSRLRLHAEQHARDHWVQCSKCGVWRIISWQQQTALKGQAAADWTCSMLRPPHTSCATPQTKRELAGMQAAPPLAASQALEAAAAAATSHAADATAKAFAARAVPAAAPAAGTAPAGESQQMQTADTAQAVQDLAAASSKHHEDQGSCKRRRLRVTSLPEATLQSARTAAMQATEASAAALDSSSKEGNILAAAAQPAAQAADTGPETAAAAITAEDVLAMFGSEALQLQADVAVAYLCKSTAGQLNISMARSLVATGAATGASQHGTGTSSDAGQQDSKLQPQLQAESSVMQVSSALVNSCRATGAFSKDSSMQTASINKYVSAQQQKQQQKRPHDQVQECSKGSGDGSALQELLQMTLDDAAGAAGAPAPKRQRTAQQQQLDAATPSEARVRLPRQKQYSPDPCCCVNDAEGVVAPVPVAGPVAASSPGLLLLIPVVKQLVSSWLQLLVQHQLDVWDDRQQQGLLAMTGDTGLQQADPSRAATEPQPPAAAAAAAGEATAAALETVSVVSQQAQEQQVPLLPKRTEEPDRPGLAETEKQQQDQESAAKRPAGSRRQELSRGMHQHQQGNEAGEAEAANVTPQLVLRGSVSSAAAAAGSQPPASSSNPATPVGSTAGDAAKAATMSCQPDGRPEGRSALSPEQAPAGTSASKAAVTAPEPASDADAGSPVPTPCTPTQVLPAAAHHNTGSVPARATSGLGSGVTASAALQPALPPAAAAAPAVNGAIVAETQAPDAAGGPCCSNAVGKPVAAAACTLMPRAEAAVGPTTEGSDSKQQQQHCVPSAAQPLLQSDAQTEEQQPAAAAAKSQVSCNSNGSGSVMGGSSSNTVSLVREAAAAPSQTAALRHSTTSSGLQPTLHLSLLQQGLQPAVSAMPLLQTAHLPSMLASAAGVPAAHGAAGSSAVPWTTSSANPCTVKLIQLPRMLMAASVGAAGSSQQSAAGCAAAAQHSGTNLPRQMQQPFLLWQHQLLQRQQLVLLAQQRARALMLQSQTQLLPALHAPANNRSSSSTTVVLTAAHGAAAAVAAASKAAGAGKGPQLQLQQQQQSSSYAVEAEAKLDPADAAYRAAQPPEQLPHQLSQHALQPAVTSAQACAAGGQDLNESPVLPGGVMQVHAKANRGSTCSDPYAACEPSSHHVEGAPALATSAGVAVAAPAVAGAELAASALAGAAAAAATVGPAATEAAGGEPATGVGVACTPFAQDCKDVPSRAPPCKPGVTGDTVAAGHAADLSTTTTSETGGKASSSQHREAPAHASIVSGGAAAAAATEAAAAEAEGASSPAAAAAGQSPAAAGGATNSTVQRVAPVRLGHGAVWGLTEDVLLRAVLFEQPTLMDAVLALLHKVCQLRQQHQDQQQQQQHSQQHGYGLSLQQQQHGPQPVLSMSAGADAVYTAANNPAGGLAAQQTVPVQPMEPTDMSLTDTPGPESICWDTLERLCNQPSTKASRWARRQQSQQLLTGDDADDEEEVVLMESEDPDEEEMMSSLELARAARVAANKAYLAGLGLSPPALQRGQLPALDCNHTAVSKAARKLAKQAAVSRARKQLERSQRLVDARRRARRGQEMRLRATLEALAADEAAAAQQVAAALATLADVEKEAFGI